jgi:hypothetical protein
MKEGKDKIRSEDEIKSRLKRYIGSCGGGEVGINISAKENCVIVIFKCKENYQNLLSTTMKFYGGMYNVLKDKNLDDKNSIKLFRKDLSAIDDGLNTSRTEGSDKYRFASLTSLLPIPSCCVVM